MLIVVNQLMQNADCVILLGVIMLNVILQSVIWSKVDPKEGLAYFF